MFEELWLFFMFSRKLIPKMTIVFAYHVHYFHKLTIYDKNCIFKAVNLVFVGLEL